MFKGMIAIAGGALFWGSALYAQGAAQDAAQDTAQDTAQAAAPAADPVALAKVAAVQRHVDAYRSGDLDRFVATFTADARVVANGIVATGRAEIRALYAANFAPGAPSIRITDSGIEGGAVFLSVGYVFEDGQEMCCSYTEYEIDLASDGGQISALRSTG